MHLLSSRLIMITTSYVYVVCVRSRQQGSVSPSAVMITSVRLFFKESFSSCAGRSKEAIDRLYHPTGTAESLSWSWWSWPPVGSASSHANKELNTVFPWAITLLFHQPADSIDQYVCGGNVLNWLWEKSTESAEKMLKENKKQVALDSTKCTQSEIDALV